MIPRLDIRFPLKRQWNYWFGKQYEPVEGEYLLNHARTGIIMVLRAALPNGGRVGVVVYNCHTVANAVVNAGCVPVFVDVTEDLRIDVESVPVDLDAIVVTNLFGIRNDVEAIRKRCPGAVIIVDNAHGYGLPVEGDFTVYSINQGKFPALGPGGILVVSQKLPTISQKLELEENKNIDKHCFAEINNENNLEDKQKNDKKNTESSKDTESISTVTTPQSTHKQASGLLDDSLRLKDIVIQYPSDDSEKNTKNNFSVAIDELYEALPKYGFVAQVKLFCSMLIKALAYSRCVYWLTMRKKKSSNPNVHEHVVMRQMAPGIRRLYRSALPEIESQIASQRKNAEQIKASVIEDRRLKIEDWMVGENAFMLIAKTQDPAALQAWFAERGVETATHFSRAIEWATEFGYVSGSCPNAEKLVHQLLMIPTYRRF